MKKMMSLLVALLMLLTCLPVLAEEVDAVSSPSTYDWVPGLTGAELVDAVNNIGGFKAIGTCDENGKVYVGAFGFRMTTYEGVDYVVCNFSPDSTITNIKNGSDIVAVYAMPVAPEEGKPVSSYTGAHLWLEVLEDEELAAKVAETSVYTGSYESEVVVFNIVAVGALG